jgi:hypothetical protein
MELSTGQKRGLFVVLVVLLAGLGIYLIGPGRDNSGSPSASKPSGSSPSAATTTAPASLAGVPSYEVQPTSAPVPTTIKSANIYDWLPFTPSDLKTAANVTVAFAGAYETYSYTDTWAEYGKRLSGYATSSLLTSLEQTFQTGLPTWQQEHLTSKSAGTINSITLFGASPKSITFLVTITEQQTSQSGSTPSTGQYDVTTVAVAGGWQVNDIEQSGQGNQ